jgi:hypothetical protein
MTFKKGDRVRILRKAWSREKGWGNSWVAEYMDAAVGQIGTVVAVDANRQDVEIEVLGVDDIWGYPDFVLQKVRKTVKAAPKKRVRHAKP